MPITRFTVALSEPMRDRLMRVGASPDQPRRTKLWIALVVVGVAISVAAFFFIGGDGALPVLGSAVMLLLGVVLAVFGVVALLGGAAIRAAQRRERIHADEALAKNEMHIVEIDADAAWSATSIDDDVPAFLLRAGPDRFIYFNTGDLYDVVEEIEGDPDRQRIPAGIRVIRCPPWLDPAAIERRDDSPMIEVDDALPSISNDELTDCLSRGECAESLGFGVLTLDQLPAEWQEFLTERSA